MNQSMKSFFPMNLEGIKHTAAAWVLNLMAWCLSWVPLMQFVALSLAIFVSVSTLTINIDKIRNRFLNHKKPKS